LDPGKGEGGVSGALGACDFGSDTGNVMAPMSGCRRFCEGFLFAVNTAGVDIVTKPIKKTTYASSSTGLTRRAVLGTSTGVMLAALTGNKSKSSGAAANTFDAVEAIMAGEKRRKKTGQVAGAVESNHNNTLYIMPIWEGGLDNPHTTDSQYRKQIRKMKTAFGEGNTYNKLGFASIYSIGNVPLLLRQLKMFREEGIHRGVIFAMQTHNNGITNPNGDFRNYQWRLNGKTWRGAPGHPDGRDTLVVTPSRYAEAVRVEMREKARRWAREIKKAMRAYPGVISIINIIIEEELAIGGVISNAYLADYSPFAVTEFRDWLCHRGLYAPGAQYAGQGAPEAIVGAFIKSYGNWASPFYHDPSPENSDGRGKTFNETFGTKFKTWTLAYWDLTRFPDPITDSNFDPMPKAGKGFTSGGFDAPRVRNHSNWWRAWDWTYQGHHNTFPPGNPGHPAYGFRECEVAHFVRDVADLLLAEGLPKELIYAHQIPAELLGDAPAGARRALSSASTIWSGYLPQNGHVGITRFGPLNPSLITQYAKNWGIFEWHPAPNESPNSPALYDIALKDLRLFVANGCRALFPGWWHSKRIGKTFPLNDSGFARAINKFLSEQPDAPHPILKNASL
jgi:hypothetical protein